MQLKQTPNTGPLAPSIPLPPCPFTTTPPT